MPTIHIPQYYTTIEGVINGCIVQENKIWHTDLPAYIRRYREILIDESGRKPWAIFIRVEGSMRNEKGNGKSKESRTELDKIIDAIISRKGIEIEPHAGREVNEPDF